MRNLDKKPEFRDVLFYGRPSSITAVHWWLYQTCDRYVIKPVTERCAQPCCGGGDTNGAQWMYQFLLWKDARQELSLNFMSYGEHSLWMSFTVDGQTTRSVTVDRLNAFELCRRVRDKVSEVYRYIRETCPEDADGMAWVLSNVETEDGLGPIREYVYKKYFVLDRPTSWVDEVTGEPIEPDPEDTTYFFIPLDLLGEMFVPAEKEVA